MIKVEHAKTLIPSSLLEGISPEILNVTLQHVAAAARDHWMMLASKIRSSFRADYIDGIQQVEIQQGVAVLALVGAIPQMLEHGTPQLDLRTTLLGPNVPVVPRGQPGKHLNKKGGYYRAIPFRHMTPGSGGAPRGKTSGQEMGSAYSSHEAVADSRKLGKEIYGAAKKLAASIGAPGEKTVYGGRLEAGMAPKLKAHHKTDIYAGMIRETKVYEKATQAKYFTFRTISTSVKEGWIRGPIRARNLAQKVSAFAAKLAPKAIQAFVEAG